MYLMDSQIPMKSIKGQISNAVEIYVHLMRDKNGNRKVVEIAEMIGIKDDDYELNYLFVRNGEDELIRTKNKLINNEKLIRGSS